jgi:hypothetical protein
MSLIPIKNPLRIGLLFLLGCGLSLRLHGSPVPRSQSVSWVTPDNLPILPGNTVELSAAADSGLPVSFRLVAGPAVLNGSSLTTTNLGTVVVSAEQGGDEAFAPTNSLRLFNRTGVEFSPIGQWPRTPYLAPTSAQVRGSLAYLALESRRLVVLDVSGTGDPELVGQLTLPSSPTDLHLGGDLAAVAVQSGVELVDVSNPTSPRRMGSIQTGAPVLGVRLQGGLAFLATGPLGVRIFDVSDSQQPRLLGSAETGHAANAVRVAGTLVLVASNEGLEIVDASDPTRPVPVSFLSTSSAARTLELEGTRAYVGTEGGGLLAVDFQDPVRPVLLGRSAAGSIRSIRLLDGVALVSVAPTTLQAVDIRNASGLAVVGSLRLPGTAIHVGTTGGRLLAFGPGIGVQPVDFSDPANPVAGLEYNGNPAAERVEVSDGIAYLVQDSVLSLLDIRDPARPVRVGRHRSSGMMYVFSVDGSRVWMTRLGMLECVDVSDPSRPQLLLRTNWNVIGNWNSLQVRNGLGHATSSSSYLQFDLREPSNPILLGSYPAPAGKWLGSMVVRDRKAYISGSELRILDVGNPAVPLVESVLSGFGSQFALDVDGDGDHLALFGERISLLDIRNPSSPRLLASHRQSGKSFYFGQLHGRLAFSFNSDQELTVTDLTEPTATFLAGKLPNSGYGPFRLSPSGAEVFSVGASPALRIHRVRRSLLQTSGFTAASSLGGDRSPLPLPPLSSAGLPLTYSVVSGPALLTNQSLLLNGPGRVVVRVTQEGNPQFTGIDERWSFNVTEVGQRLAWVSPTTNVLDRLNHPYPVIATNASGLPIQVQFAGGPGRLGPDGLVATNDGYLHLVATSPAAWPFSEARISDFWKVARRVRSLDWGGAASHEVLPRWNVPFPIEVRGDDGLLAQLTIQSGPGRLEGGHLVVTNDGPVVVVAELAGDDRHTPVRQQRTFEVRRAPQSIAWNQPRTQDVLRLRELRRLSATASSGLPVRYRLAGGPASVEGDIVTVTNVGTVRVLAEQPGDDSWLPTSQELILNRAMLGFSDQGGWLPDFRGPVHAVRAEEDRIHVAVGGEGLLIQRLSTNREPVRLGFLRTGGGMEDLQVRDGRAWIADGTNGLLVADVRVPERPSELGRLRLGGPAFGVALSGSTACVALGEAGLVLVDITDPTRLRELGRIDTPGTALKVVTQGTLAYVADLSGGLRIIDISNPRAPLSVGSLDPGGPVFGVAVVGDTAYVCSDSAGLVLVDIRDPARPVRKGTFETDDRAFGVTVRGDLALLSTVRGGLLSIDTSDPARPVLRGRHAPGSFIRGSEWMGEQLLVADQRFGVRLLARLTPELFGDLASLPLQGDPWGGIRVEGGIALVGCGSIGVHVVDVSDPIDLRLLATIDTPGLPTAVDIVGNVACIADGGEGIHLYDLANPVRPRWLSTFDTEGFAGGVRISGGMAYVADHERGLVVVDIRDPVHPVRAAVVPSVGYVFSCWVEGNRLYLIERDLGLQIWDVSQPALPVLLGGRSSPVPSYSVTVADGLAYVGVGDKGFRIVDVLDPRSPIDIGSVTNVGVLRQIHVESGVAYLANHTSGLIRLDLRNPAAPVRQASLQLGGPVFGVTQSGSTLYAAVRGRGLVALDAVDPLGNGLLSEIPFGGGARGIDLEGDRVYVADGIAGVRILDAGGPARSQVGVHMATRGEARDVRVANGILLVAEGGAGLGVVDVSHPEAPGSETVYPIPGTVESVERVGSRVFLAAGTRGLVEGRLTGGDYQTVYVEFPRSGYAWHVRVAGTNAFVAKDSVGLETYDLGGVGAPRRRSTFRTLGPARAVAVAGGLVGVAEGHAGIELVDVSDPDRPRLVSRVGDLGDVGDVWIDGDRLWMATGRGGLKVLDLHDPAAPVLVGSLASLDATARVRTRGNRVYMAEGSAGLRVLESREGLSQVVTFRPPSRVALDAPAVRLIAVSDSGLEVRLEVESGPARLLDGLLEPSRTGRVVVRATQPGDALFLPESLATTIEVVETLPRIVPGSLQPVAGGIRFHAEGRVGEPLVLLESEDLRTWRELPLGSFPDDGTREVELEVSSTARFLRVRPR